jgi:hypothetical protein
MSLSKKKKIVKKRKFSPENFLFFCFGVLAGSLLILSIALATMVKSTEGINIYVSGERVLEIISRQIEQQVQEEFPGFIKEIKLEAPSLVEKYMQDFITIGNLEIGGYTVNLPPQFIKELENDLRNDVTYYVLELLEELEKEQFVQELSQGITDDVLKTLLTDLNGQVVKLPFTKRYSIPVVVWFY